MDVVQFVTEQVAAFKLLPRTFRNFQARIAQLEKLPAVRNSPSLSDSVGHAKQSTNDLMLHYNTTNTTVDRALSELDRAKAAGGGVSLGLLALAGDAAFGMTRAFSGTRATTDLIERVEQQVLSPAQRSNAGFLGTSSFGGSGSVKTLLILAGAAFVVPSLLKGR